MLAKSKKCLLLVFSGLILSSCGGGSQSIKMKGSDTEVNLAVTLAEHYTKVDPSFNISISGGGSGLGITALLNGQADIANSSRPLSEKESKQFKDKGVEIVTIVFAEDATAFVVNKELPMEEIDIPTLALIMSGKVKNWREILPEINLPINIYGRQSSSGTHSFIKKKLKIEFSNAAKEMTGNAQILEGVKIDKSGIGYVGAGYVGNEAVGDQKFKVLKIKADSVAVAYSPLDPSTINSSLYFFQRPLYQFVVEKSWHKVKPFIDFEQAAQGKKLIEEHGYYIIDKIK